MSGKMYNWLNSMLLIPWTGWLNHSFCTVLLQWELDNQNNMNMYHNLNMKPSVTAHSLIKTLTLVRKGLAIYSLTP